LPALAVGISIYLPPEVMTPIIIGTLISYFVKRKTKKAKNEAEIKQYNKAYQYSILVACGMVAGSAVIGVILAIPFAIAGSSDALSIMPDSLQNVATIISAVIFIGFCVWFYRIATKK
jgi:uncharacterized oligopeptide transporter (OPT) family protein